MIILAQLLTLLYCVVFLVAALLGKGALHDSVVTVAMSLAILAIVRQVLILWFSHKERKRYREESEQTIDASLAPKISILVPAYNEARVIEAALQSMLELSYPNYEVLLLDDGSTDGTYDVAAGLVESSNGKLRVFRQVNQGKAAALNLGLRISKSSFVLCVDADSTIEPEGLSHAIRHFKDPNIAGVAGVVDVRLGTGKFISRLQRTEYMMSQRLTRSAIAFFKSIPIVPGPAGLFRRQALIDAGGYIPAEDCFAEDAELTIRLLADGHDIVSEPKLISVTEAPKDLFSLLRQRYRWCRGSMQALFLNTERLIFGKSERGPSLFLYLLSEIIIFPTLCFGVALFFLANSLVYGEITAFTVGLIVLVGMEVLGLFLVSENKKMFPVYLIEYLAIRLVYAYILTAWTLLCLRDEMTAVKMGWDKLDRYGVQGS